MAINRSLSQIEIHITGKEPYTHANVKDVFRIRIRGIIHKTKYYLHYDRIANEHLVSMYAGSFIFSLDRLRGYQLMLMQDCKQNRESIRILDQSGSCIIVPPNNWGLILIPPMGLISLHIFPIKDGKNIDDFVVEAWSVVEKSRKIVKRLSTSL